MVVLGITEEGDAGVSVVSDGHLVFALNEERLTRKKLQAGFPVGAAMAAARFLKQQGLWPSAVAVGGKIHLSEFGIPKRPTVPQRVLGFLSQVGLADAVVGTQLGVTITGAGLRLMQGGRERRVAADLAAAGFPDFQPRFYDHHLCHATSAYFTSGFDDALVITVDAAGDGFCSRVYTATNGRLHLLHSVPFFHSIGYYYTLATFALGFKEGQQGKVTGLAATGDPDKAIAVFERKIPYNSRRMLFENKGQYFFYELPALTAALKGISREDVSAAIQLHLERSVVAYIRDLFRRFNLRPRNVALAGGVFANVLLNQRIGEMEEVAGVFVHPHMGDGGLATGAAYAFAAEHDPSFRSPELGDVFLGPEIGKDEVRGAVTASGFAYTQHSPIEPEVAKVLADGRVVARFEGRMEYGPRALGHRSILCHAKDHRINDWLNKRLQRSEFMPFAPVVLDVDAEKYFHIKGRELPARFMTITCQATERCIAECPAVVHVDGTARPQIITRHSTPSYYAILEEYKRLTGISVLINTSFNMHEEPIVSSPEMAIDCFSRGHLDYLAIGDFLMRQPSMVTDDQGGVP